MSEKVGSEKKLLVRRSWLSEVGWQTLMVRRSWWSEEAGAQKKLVLRTSWLSGEISWSEEVAG